MKNSFRAEEFTGTDEKIIYCDKPVKKNYPVTEIVLLAISMILVIAIDGFLVGSSFMKNILEKTGINSTLIFVIGLIVHFVPLGAWLLSVNKKIYFANNSYVLVTDKKASVVSSSKTFIETGVRYDEVVGFFTENGKLVFATEDGNFVINGVREPETVAEKIKEALSRE